MKNSSKNNYSEKNSKQYKKNSNLNFYSKNANSSKKNNRFQTNSEGNKSFNSKNVAAEVTKIIKKMLLVIYLSNKKSDSASCYTSK